MSFLAELLAIVVVWLSSIALGQLGVAIDQSPRANAAHPRTVSRSPSQPAQTPGATASSVEASPAV